MQPQVQQRIRRRFTMFCGETDIHSKELTHYDSCAAQICKDGRILADFQDRIRAVLEAGEDPEAFTRQLLKDPPAVITLDEVGCGIVPLEKSERNYREAVGHAGQMLAAAAAEVYRMQCGIAVRIK